MPKSAIEKNGMSLGMDVESTDFGLQGTTAIAHHFNEGSMLGVESRISKEKEKQPKKELKIYDNMTKSYAISSHVMAIMLGIRNDSLEMQRHMLAKCSRMESVSNVFKTAEEYVTGFRGENKRFGTILCGFEAKVSRIFSVYVNGEEVVKTTDLPFVSLGSGSGHAKEMARKIMGSSCLFDGTFNLSLDESIDFTLRCLFDATFKDKFSGGPLCVYQACDGRWKHVRSCDILDAYSAYYDSYKEENILSLIFNCARGQHLCANDLLSYFRSYGIYRVAQICVAENVAFYFHRLVCSTPEDASGIYDHVKGAGSYHLTATPDNAAASVILNAFPYRVTIKIKQSSIPLYVNRASRELLQLIQSSCIYR